MIMVGQTWLAIQTNSSGTLLDELIASNFFWKTSVKEGVDAEISTCGQRDISKP